MTLTNDEAGVAHAIRTQALRKKTFSFIVLLRFDSDNGNESSKCDSDISDGSCR